MKRILASAVAIFAAQVATAQEAKTVSVAESDMYGEYLTVDDQAVYLFTADTQGGDGTDPRIACGEDCLSVWPLVMSAGSPEAGDGAMSEMVGTMEHDGETVVTYDGWPLYHFARDGAGLPPEGQEIESFGGEWYLIAPDGTRIEGEAG